MLPLRPPLSLPFWPSPEPSSKGSKAPKSPTSSHRSLSVSDPSAPCSSRFSLTLSRNVEKNRRRSSSPSCFTSSPLESRAARAKPRAGARSTPFFSSSPEQRTSVAEGPEVARSPLRRRRADPPELPLVVRSRPQETSPRPDPPLAASLLPPLCRTKQPCPWPLRSCPSPEDPFPVPFLAEPKPSSSFTSVELRRFFYRFQVFWKMQKEVILSESSPSSSFSSSEYRLICRVCQKQFSQYTCPRCNSRYCSMECYKKHSLRCTESFMRENVMGELQQMQPEGETKRKMLEILKRFHSEEEEGEDEDMNGDHGDDSILSEQIIQKVLAGEEIKLEDLSPHEIKQFQRAVASGELSRMIEPWTPWWEQPSARTISLSPDGTQLIKPVQEQEEESHVNEVPAGPDTPISPVSCLSTASPSPLLSLHLVDILYSYCFTLRRYNGDWRSDSLGAATEVLTVSNVLGDDGRPETLAEAVSFCLEKTCSPAYRHTGGLKFGVGLIDDVVGLLRLGGNALVCLLCDLQRMLKAGERMLKTEARGKGRCSHKLKGAERKVYFLMCWVHEQPQEVWFSLADILEVEKASVLSSVQGSKKPTGTEEDILSQSKVLIEEV